MRVIKQIRLMQSTIQSLKRQGKKIGFVPTMGALHEGHASLIKKCRRENDIVVVSIFVNPKQFGLKEDFSRYPRPEKKDNLLAKKEKVDIIFYPSERKMYPTNFLTSIAVDQLDQNLCGKIRPGHFKGVTTVVGKLLNIVDPDVMYLGQKDAQQAVILKRMAVDLNFPVQIKICPTVRETNGLALSSRNNYLNEKDRREAMVLFQSLKHAKKHVLSGERNAARIIRQIGRTITEGTSGKIDYITCVDYNTLMTVKNLRGKILIALAVHFSKTRLIDNIIVQVS